MRSEWHCWRTSSHWLLLDQKTSHTSIRIHMWSEVWTQDCGKQAACFLLESSSMIEIVLKPQLEDEIFDLAADNPTRNARNIGGKLGVDPNTINEITETRSFIRILTTNHNPYLREVQIYLQNFMDWWATFTKNWSKIIWTELDSPLK